MFTENQIDKLIQPLIDRQQRIEQEIIEIIGKRIADVKEITPSDVRRLGQMRRTGADVKAINKKLSELSRFSERQIKGIIKTAAQDAYEDAKPFYDYRQITQIPFDTNKPLQKAIEAAGRVSLGNYSNLSKTTAFLMRDRNNPLIVKVTPAAKAYREIVDRAVQSSVTGMGSYNTLIIKAIQDLTKRGLTAVEYTTDEGKEHRIRLDSAVRRNILDGIRDVQQTIQNMTGEEFSADGVELSVHMNSAPDHEPIQGHQFTNEQFDRCQTGLPFKDVNGIQFAALDRPIGVWNCRHLAFRIIIGEKTPNYTLAELEKIKADNADGITVKNKQGKDEKKSMYWCTQRMRQYETDIRRAKEGQAMAETAEEEAQAEKFKAEVSKLNNEYKVFCNKCGLKPRFDKTRIYI